VRKSNPRVQTALFPQCRELLRLAGFTDVGDAFVCGGELPGSGLREVLVFVEAALASLPRDAAGPDGAAEQGAIASPGSSPPPSRNVTEVAKDVLATTLPAEHVREGLRTVYLLLSQVKTQLEPDGRVQVPSNLQALTNFPLCIDLLLCAGFQDWGESLAFRGATKGDQVEVVQDAVLALLQASVDEGRAEEVSQDSSSEQASTSPQRRQGAAPSSAPWLQARGGPQLAPEAQGAAQLQPGCQRVPLHSIRFSQSSIASAFQNGRSVQETVQQLQCGDLRIEDLPTIRVVEHMSLLWSLDNRRLHCMKKAFPERKHPHKLVNVQLESLANRRVRDEFLRKFTAGTAVVQRGGVQGA